MSTKVRVELEDSDVILHMSPKSLEKCLICIDGDAYLSYGDGAEPVLIHGDYEDILQDIAMAKRE